jgi:6-phospho-3-hexuloisomerase
MRLMHVGKNAHIVGETCTPRICCGHLLVAISASGRTRMILDIAAVARRQGAKVIAMTACPDSPLAESADYVLGIERRVH